MRFAREARRRHGRALLPGGGRFPRRFGPDFSPRRGCQRQKRRVIPTPSANTRYRNAANDRPGQAAWLNAWPILGQLRADGAGERR
jgi:hypothetical protein